MSPHPVPRSREVAESQALTLFHQATLGWGKDHEITALAAELAAKMKASNLAYEPVNQCAGCVNAKAHPTVVCRVHGTSANV